MAINKTAVAATSATTTTADAVAFATATTITAVLVPRGSDYPLEVFCTLEVLIVAKKSLEINLSCFVQPIRLKDIN